MKRLQVEINYTDHLETLRRCDGYYECPKDAGGKRIGDLVGYAKTYNDSDGTKKQMVGDVYANYAMAEMHPQVNHHFAQATVFKLMDNKLLADIDVFCGMPFGGYSFADMLGFVSERQVIKAEKKIIALATKDVREQSELMFGRHHIENGVKYAITEDICNNRSTAEEAARLIYALGGKVTTIVCFLNRSPGGLELFHAPLEQPVPVISLVRKPLAQYRQDDPEVANDIAAGKIVLKPKNNWGRLMSYK